MELQHRLPTDMTPLAGPVLPLVVTVLAFAYHIIIAVLVNYIPDDGFAAGMTAYALIGAVLSTMGFVGVILKRPQLISLFAAFLLVDALVAVISRLLILWVITNAMLTEAWQTCMAAAPYGFERFELLEVSPKHDVVTSASWQRAHAAQGRRHCGWALQTIQLLMMGIVMGVTMLQATLAIGIRRYGKQVERCGQGGHSQEEEEVLMGEKLKLEQA